MAAPRIVISFAAEDEPHANQLRKHLAPLVEAGVVRTWHLGDLPAGSDREAVSRREMREATMIVPVVSADYLADERECRAVRSAHEEHGVRIVPVVIRACLFERSLLAVHSPLPRSGGALLPCADPDAAWSEVAKEIVALVDSAGAREVEAAAERTPRPGPLAAAPPGRRLPRWVAVLAVAALVAAVVGIALLATGRRGARPAGRCPAGMVLVSGGVELREPDAGRTPGGGAAVPPFCMDRTEVSVDDYASCVGHPREELGCVPAPRTVLWPGTYSEADIDVVSPWCNAGRPERGHHPINCVDWEMASSYCRWAGKALPTASQWRLAASAGDRRRYPWGSRLLRRGS